MNIRDIAAAAQVSVSTVSKVINGKDADISEATRQKVLQIIREYQYTPYSNIKKLVKQPKLHALAVLIHSPDFFAQPFLGALHDQAQKSGYSTLLCSAGDSDEAELEKHLKILLSKEVDGLVFCTHSPDALSFVARWCAGKLPMAAVTSATAPQCTTLRCNYFAAASQAVSLLASQGHQSIGFILDGSTPTIYEQVHSGIVAALHSHSIVLNNYNMIKRQPGDLLDVDIQNLLGRNLTAIYCQTYELAMHLYDYLLRNGVYVPQTLSLLCGLKTPSAEQSRFTAYEIPYGELAVEAVNALARPGALQDKLLNVQFWKGDTVSAPSGSEAPMLVLGNCAVDTILSVTHLPKSSELISSPSIVTEPGGKGVSQSIALARLGGCAYCIGRVGNDVEGRSILSALMDNSVHTDGVVTDNTVMTSRSFLAVAEDGSYSVIAHPGANRFLDIQSIKRLQYLLPSVSACLVSTEVPYSVVKYLIQKCVLHQIKIFFKPSARVTLEPSLLTHIDFFIPSDTELHQLLPGPQSIEEKAAYFFENGCKNVIVTMPDSGCYLKNADYELFVPPANFRPVEAVGVATCFISALAMMLTRGNNLLYAISYATYAAGICISQYGTYSSYPYKSQLDMLLDEINDFYLRLRKAT